MWRSVRNYLIQALHRKPSGWYPLLAVYYLTYACDFRCPYCSDGSQVPYHRLPREEVPAADVLHLLGTIRQYCDYLVITGGEPFNHPECRAVLKGLPSLGFDGIVLTTNGYAIEPYLPLINGAVRYLVFSIDTMDHAKADRWFGVGPGALAKILRNIRTAAEWPRRSYDIIISAVATPNNLQDLTAVFRFCIERGFRFALAPQLLGVKPHPALVGNPAYQEIFDALIAAKKRGAAVQGSIAYLQHMRDLTKFSCHPSTLLAVAPGGDVFYPCLERGTIAGNLLQSPDLHALRRRACRSIGPEPLCDNRCHSACALGLALILDRPLTMVRDAWLSILSGCTSKRGKYGFADPQNS
jgi:MoaA/NifB/PqqE/SkfB family radical SAM enzyme